MSFVHWVVAHQTMLLGWSAFAVSELLPLVSKYPALHAVLAAGLKALLDLGAKPPAAP